MSVERSYERGTRAISISASNADAAGLGFSLSVAQVGWLPRIFTWQVLVSGGVYSALNVVLEGSLDGTNWFTLDTSTTVGGETRHVVDKPVIFIRARKVSSTTSSGTPLVTVSIAA